MHEPCACAHICTRNRRSAYKASPVQSAYVQKSSRSAERVKHCRRGGALTRPPWPHLHIGREALGLCCRCTPCRSPAPAKDRTGGKKPATAHTHGHPPTPTHTHTNENDRQAGNLEGEGATVYKWHARFLSLSLSLITAAERAQLQGRKDATKH